MHQITFRLYIYLLCLLCFSASLSAHTLKESTAQVILRDGQVEITIITQQDHLIIAMQNDLAWLMGDLQEVMPDNLSAAKQQAFIAHSLQKSTQLTVNNKSIDIQTGKLVAHEKGEIEITLQAKHQFEMVKDISVSFSKTLGVVHVSFVKPQYALVKAGQAASASF
ncbi:hypothetical protein [Psychromonas sp. KJ10-2]|uniref:hypothetical protein n=1 Tax=Psychromonas sp. KJ10-2 TaxID=3391822 RepID=UPI0039B4AE02